MSASATGGRRYFEVDYVKAVGIAVVPLIHCLRPIWSPGISDVELFLGAILNFAVPGFLAVSGFLYATRERVPLALTLRRLTRVLVPYLIASAAAQAFHALHGDPNSLSEIGVQLFFGAAFGPYYFVFLITVLILVTPLFAILPTRWMLALTLALLFAQGYGLVQAALAEVPEWHFFSGGYWALRSPMIWWNYFLLGWLLRLSYARLAPWISANWAALAGGFTALIVALISLREMDTPVVVDRLSGWFLVYSILALLWVLGRRAKTLPGAVAFLSETTYPIYLFHLFFVYEAAKLFPHAPRVLDPTAVLVPWAAGIVGSLAIIWTARALLGQRARIYLGA